MQKKTTFFQKIMAGGFWGRRRRLGEQMNINKDGCSNDEWEAGRRWEKVSREFIA